MAVGGLVIYPQLQQKREVQARLAEAEQHYQAGVAFQNVGDWDKAAQEYEKVIVVEANYRDVQTRLADVKGKQAESEATAKAEVQATAAAASTATAEALEVHYQKGLGYANIGRWEEAKAELEQVFEVDPNYKEVQAKLTEVEVEVAKLTPTATPTPVTTPTPMATSTPAVHAYDDCSQPPGSTKCCCFVQFHLHDLGQVFAAGTNIRIVWQAGTPGGNCPGGDAVFSVSTDMISWEEVGQAAVAPRQGFGDIRHTQEFVSPADFRYVKVDIPKCYNDYSSAEVNYEQ